MRCSRITERRWWFPEEGFGCVYRPGCWKRPVCTRCVGRCRSQSWWLQLGVRQRHRASGIRDRRCDFQLERVERRSKPEPARLMIQNAFRAIYILVLLYIHVFIWGFGKGSHVYGHLSRRACIGFHSTPWWNLRCRLWNEVFFCANASSCVFWVDAFHLHILLRMSRQTWCSDGLHTNRSKPMVVSAMAGSVPTILSRVPRSNRSTSIVFQETYLTYYRILWLQLHSTLDDPHSTWCAWFQTFFQLLLVHFPRVMFLAM